jgi:uncharacterized protein (DUF2236 family)
MAPRLVSADDLEALLTNLGESSSCPEQGIFVPGSVSWKVNRESALFLAATRAALLQLAHPWVASAIAQHSKTFHDPISRFHRTFRVMFTVSFGSMEQALGAARQLHRMHQSIRGAVPESVGRFVAGSSYEANEVAALRWVYATLIDSSVLAYDLVLTPLTEVEREQYYRESRTAASLFGVPYEYWPPDWTGFQTYMHSTLASDMLGVSASTRQMGHDLQRGAGLMLRPPFWYRALNVEILPPRFREEFQFTYRDREQQSAKRALRWIRRFYHRLPPAIRFVGPYNEALSRQQGKRPSLTTRFSNRIWVGQPELLTSQPPGNLRREPAPASSRKVAES